MWLVIRCGLSWGIGLIFGRAAADGRDVRVTGADGRTPIPFWIERWDPGAGVASIWVKVPSIPVGGTEIYLYYGNEAAVMPSSDPVPVPPTGPYSKDPGNPQRIAGAPCGADTPRLLPENMVAADGKYYLVVTDRACDAGSIGLLTANSPSGPWSYAKRILTMDDLAAQGDARNQLDSPHLLKVGSDWYLFYSHFYPSPNFWNETDRPAPLGLAKSTNGILGPYQQVDPAVLSTGPLHSWDDARVCEPYVLQQPNGDWVMLYMGDADPHGGFTEQIGVATSTSGVEGPYVKSPSNPVIRFGPPGSLDAGTIADPWVVEFQGTYYVGYTASSTKQDWNTTYATTTDWQTFTKSNTVILGQGSSYDSASAFRGAVSQFGDTYYFPYAALSSGSKYRFAFATQRALAPPIGNNPDAVFGFYDGFSGSALDTSKWRPATRSTSGGSVTVAGGQLTLTAPRIGKTNMQQLIGTTSFGPGSVLLEAQARHVTARGDATTAGELGFGVESFDPSLRIADYNNPSRFTKNVTNNGTGGNNYLPMATPLDSTNYLLHRIAWTPGAATFSLAADPPETIATNIPTQPLPPWLAAVATGNQATLSVDWIRVRNWIGAEAQTTTQPEETQGSTAPVPPTITASDPASPANDTNPELSGTAASDSVAVRLYSAPTTGDCTAANLVGEGSRASFEGAGITVTVGEDQTTQLRARALDQAGNASDCSGSFAYTEDSTAPVPPTITASDPASPANDTNPELSGTAASDSVAVRLYSAPTTGDCTAANLVGEGSRASFEGAGITVTVGEDQTTQLRARALDQAGNASDCSGSFAYTEDSTAPVPPTITASDPASPANDTNPELSGTAASDSVAVRLYSAPTTGDCTAANLVGEGSRASFEGAGITVTVGEDQTTQLRARALDQAGNASDCSGSFAYTEDSTAPVPPTITASDPASPANDTNPELSGTAASDSVAVTQPLPPWLAAVATGNQAAVSVDWIRVRNWTEPKPKPPPNQKKRGDLRRRSVASRQATDLRGPRGGLGGLSMPRICSEPRRAGGLSWTRSSVCRPTLQRPRCRTLPSARSRRVCRRSPHRDGGVEGVELVEGERGPSPRRLPSQAQRRWSGRPFGIRRRGPSRR